MRYNKQNKDVQLSNKDILRAFLGNENPLFKHFAQITGEKTVKESSTHADSQFQPYNPDDLYQKDGDYSTYEEMLHDDQVSISMQIKKDLVLGNGWEITSQDEGDDEIREDIEKAINDDPEDGFDDMLEEIISAYDFGFSLSEKSFKLRDDKSLTLKRIRTRHPSTWLIHQDEYGNITKFVQAGKNGDIEVNPKSLIHYVNKPKFQNPYGESDLRVVYNAWFAKQEIVKYYAIFMEKNASPIPVAKYDKNLSNALVTSLFNKIKKFQQRTALTIPKEIEIDFLQSTSNGEAYHKAINIFNMFIGRGLFVPDLLGFQGQETTGGAQSLGREQLNVYFKHLGRRRQKLERVVNKHIVKPIVEYNWGDIERPPLFKLRPLDDQDILEFMRIWVDATKSGGVYKASEDEINQFRRLANLPEGEVERPDPPATPDFRDNGGDEIIDEEPIEDNKEDDKIIEDNEKEDKKEFKQVFEPVKSEAHARTDFKKLGKMLDNNLKKVTEDAKPIFQFWMDDLIDQIAKKKILNGHPERISDISIKKVRDLKMLLNRALKENFVEAKKGARADLFKGEFAEVLPSDEFLKMLEDENFDAVGKWKFTAEEQARLELRKAVKDGLPLPQIIGFTTKTFEDLNNRFERYARTKMTETMNRGRLEFFNSSEVVQGYEYSAIMDDRTTTICAGLHGKRFKRGEQPIPPIHWNCRSTLIPITVFEDFKPDKTVGGDVEVKSGKKIKVPNQNIDKFIDKNMGEGFSRQ